ncbi:hypothetical protein L1987_54928 [Smallanthus sonchifolius]|uniref:Uncharacterized protein n=1 Tax=Smallanthus sonchifolius TaxID=185202 RepID=A0ACB9E961_9ASTR|nr:hypothetical protein L1987_54928 [Smallanthus sonchifolius]
MLTFSSSVEARKFLYDKKKDHELIFKELLIWDGRDVPFDRIALVQIYGVPQHLWVGGTFERIRQTIGKVVECSVASSESGNLAFEEIGILFDSPLRVSRTPQESRMEKGRIQGGLQTVAWGHQSVFVERADLPSDPRKKVKIKTTNPSERADHPQSMCSSSSFRSGDGKHTPIHSLDGGGAGGPISADHSTPNQVGENEGEVGSGGSRSRDGKGAQNYASIPVDLNEPPGLPLVWGVKGTLMITGVRTWKWRFRTQLRLGNVWELMFPASRTR